MINYKLTLISAMHTYGFSHTYIGNNLSCGDEVLHSTKDGKGWLPFHALEEAKHAICIVDGP